MLCNDEGDKLLDAAIFEVHVRLVRRHIADSTLKSFYLFGLHSQFCFGRMVFRVEVRIEFVL